MLRAARVAGTGLTMLLLGVRGARAVPPAALAAVGRLLAGLQDSWSACSFVAKLSPCGRAVGVIVRALGGN
eukprot:12836581-Alexandrium_andersonii.AAC.1